jgi:hypothetical protein
MSVFRVLLVSLLFASCLAAQEHVSFPTEGGGVVYADIYGKGERGVVLAHGGASTRKAGRSRRERSSRQDFEC